ncbi:MAG: MFS transporter [Clostridia bacterium]
MGLKTKSAIRSLQARRERMELIGLEGRPLSPLSTPSPSTEEDLKNFVIEGALGSMMTTVTTGVYLTGFALALGATDAMIGVIAALPSLANVLQLVGSYFLVRSGSARTLCLVSLMAHRVSWFFIAAIPLVGLPTNHAAMYLLLGIAIASAFASFTNVSWLAWIARVVPRHIRGRFFARRNVVAGAVAMISGLAVGRFLDYWKAEIETDLPFAYVTIYALALVFGLLCWFVLRRIGESDPPPPRPGSFLADLRLPLADANFRRVLVFMICWGFSVRLAAPFFDVYMIRDLAVPFSTIALLGVAAGIWNILGMRFWGPMSDLRGNKPVLLAGCILAALTPLLWIFTSPESYRILWLVNTLTPLAWASIGLVTSTLLIKMAPPEVAAVYFGVFAALVGLAEAAAPGIGGLLAGHLDGIAISLPWGGNLVGLQILFLITTILRMLSVTLLWQVRVPDEVEVANPLRALRQLREAGGRRRFVGYGVGRMESLMGSISNGTNVAEMRMERAMERGQRTIQGILLRYRRMERRVEDIVETVERRVEKFMGIAIVMIEGLIRWLKE